jgi:HK97 family phage portal protein
VSILSRLLGGDGAKAWQWTYDPPVVETFTNMTPDSGLMVGGRSTSPKRGLRLSTAYACIRLRSETIAGLPWHSVEYTGKRRTVQEPEPWMERPNDDMTGFDLFEAISAAIDTEGNSVAILIRDNLQRVREIWPVDPATVEIWRDEPTRRNPRPLRRYRVGETEYRREDVWHVPGWRLPGMVRGMNPLAWHTFTLGLSIAADTYGAAFFENGAHMSGLIETPGNPGVDKLVAMRDSFARDHAGAHNAAKPGFLFGGATWKPLQLPNDQAQFLETRKFQAEEIARIWRVPPHKVGILDRATFSNIEHQGIEWESDGIWPYTRRIEASALHVGLLPMGRKLKANTSILTRGALKDQAQAFAIGRQWGWWSADDVRAKLDEDPLPENGDVYLSPMNMTPAGELGDGFVTDDEPPVRQEA